MVLMDSLVRLTSENKRTLSREVRLGREVVEVDAC